MGRARRAARGDHTHGGAARSARRLSLVLVAAAAIVGGLGLGSLDLATAGGATSGWNIVPAPGTGADDILLGSTCASALQCWDVGVSIQNPNSTTSFVPVIETWNGSSWDLTASAPIPGGDGAGLFGVTCANGADCWAVGAVLGVAGNGNPSGTLIEQWDGTAWSIVPSPDPTGSGVVGALLQSVSCSSSTSCVAVGYASDDNGENLSALIEQWNGTAWNIVPAGASGQTYDQLSGVDCLAADDCWAVGNAGPAQQNPNFLPIFPGAVGDQGLIEHWDGTAWTVSPSAAYPSPAGGYLYGVTCATVSDCWASGALTDDTGNASGILMEQWNGVSWTDVSSSVPEPAGTGSILNSLSCVSATQCWAVGSSGTFGGGGGGGFQPAAFIENWNGSEWSIEPSPNVAALSILDSVTCVAGVGCWAAGTAATETQQNDPGLRVLVEQMTFPPASVQGIVLAARDGGVFNYGTAPFAGSMAAQHLNAPIVAVAATPDGGGYWLVGSDGGVFAYGDAQYYGSVSGMALDAPIVGMAPTPDGRGYWLVASDGGVFAYGDAGFHGSMGGTRLNAQVVGMAATEYGGYWLVSSDGGVYSFGGAGFFGSAGGARLDAAVTGMAATADGQGYWLVGSDGGVFSYGDATYLGSVPGQGITGQPPVVGISRTPTGSGYWLAGSNGAVYAYGDAAFLGAPNAARLAAPVSGVAASP